jgi:peptidase S46-like protein
MRWYARLPIPIAVRGMYHPPMIRITTRSSTFRLKTPALTYAVAWALLVGAIALRADEGMWTFDNPPLKILQDRYHFTPTAAWLDKLRLASVRFNDGGSGSFISPRGLVLTNHHVARGQLQKISSEKKNYVADGFYAPTQRDELKAPDLELNVLMSMENVTERVQRAAAGEPDAKRALDRRRAEIAKIEKESLDATGLRSDVVRLYGGGEYWLYRYQRYTDVRLVFAPEQQAAFYGGDPDNFTYPRYDLDMAIFRVYENDRPIESPGYPSWNPSGARDGDLVFVSGHPASTNRLDTVAQLETLRDGERPLELKAFNARVAALRSYGAAGSEQAREAEELIFGLENSIKAYDGELRGLRDRNVFAKKEKEEADFRVAVARDPKRQAAYGGAWTRIEAAEREQRSVLVQFMYRTPSLSFARSATLALNVVRYVVEINKPDGERLPGYHDAQLPSLRLRMFSPAPLYPGLEETLLADWLEEARTALGAADPFMQAALGGLKPAERAKALARGSRIGDAAFRKQLIDGGEAGVAASNDPMIVFARAVDPLMREMRTRHERTVESVETAAAEQIGRARFDVYGKSAYPDATFTLRLAFGTVSGYPMNGTKAPSRTTFYGLYDRALGFDLKPPFDLPKRYVERQPRLDLKTPLDFVCACDITGGNSGSPVVDQNGDLVGLIFDGNIESLVGPYVYNEANHRAVAVHAAAIVEALRTLYDAPALADEFRIVSSPTR